MERLLGCFHVSITTYSKCPSYRHHLRHLLILGDDPPGEVSEDEGETDRDHDRLLEQPTALGRHEVVGGGEAAGGLSHQRHVARVPAEPVNVVLITCHVSRHI